MDKIKAMTTFVRIVDSGSLTAAAEALGNSTAAVVRTLAALERQLGVRLINRNTRRLALTDEGAEYLAWCRRILGEFEAIEHGFDARRLQASGVLRITAPVELGREHLLPLVNQFLDAHPALSIELTLLDRIVDLLEEGLDLALRIGRLPDSSLVALPLGRTRQVICASPQLIARLGTPAHPAQLAELPCVCFAPQGRQWSFQADGEVLSVEVAAKLATNQVQAVRSACEHGLGFTRLLHYQVAPALAAGRLQRLLQPFEPPALPVQLVYPHARLLSARVRQFMDWIAPRLTAALPDAG